MSSPLRHTNQVELICHRQRLCPFVRSIAVALGHDAAYDRARAFRADAILAFADGITSGLADRFAARSRRDRIPAVSGWAVFAEKGNLMTYGPVLGESHARLAVFVDRILKGAKAADLAVERPTVHELVVNRRVAKELGIAVPPTLLARADRIID